MDTGKITRLNRLAALSIAPVMKSTPTKGLEVMYDLIPLKLHIERTALAANHRVKSMLLDNWR